MIIVYAVTTTQVSYFVLFQPKTANFCALRAIFLNYTRTNLSLKTAHLSDFSAQKAHILWRAWCAFFTFAPCPSPNKISGAGAATAYRASTNNTLFRPESTFCNLKTHPINPQQKCRKNYKFQLNGLIFSLLMIPFLLLIEK